MIMVAVSTHSEITAGKSGKLNDTHTEQKTELITVKLSLLAAGFTKVNAVYKIINVVCVEMRELQIPESYT